MNRIGEIDLHSSTLITLERGALRAPLREMGSQSLSTKAIWGLFDDARELNFVARDVIHSEIYAI